MIQLPKPHPEWEDRPGGNDLYMQCVAWAPRSAARGLFCAQLVSRTMERQYAHGDFLEKILLFHAEHMIHEIEHLRSVSYPDVPVQDWRWGFHLRRTAPHAAHVE